MWEENAHPGSRKDQDKDHKENPDKGHEENPNKDLKENPDKDHKEDPDNNQRENQEDDQDKIVPTSKRGPDTSCLLCFVLLLWGVKCAGYRNKETDLKMWQLTIIFNFVVRIQNIFWQ